MSERGRAQKESYAVLPGWKAVPLQEVLGLVLGEVIKKRSCPSLLCVMWTNKIACVCFSFWCWMVLRIRGSALTLITFVRNDFNVQIVISQEITWNLALVTVSHMVWDLLWQSSYLLFVCFFLRIICVCAEEVTYPRCRVIGCMGTENHSLYLALACYTSQSSCIDLFIALAAEYSSILFAPLYRAY